MSIDSDRIESEKHRIAAFICERREMLGFTQLELAELAGLGIATVQRIGAAAFIPDGKSLVKLCIALRCRIVFVVDGETSGAASDG